MMTRFTLSALTVALLAGTASAQSLSLRGDLLPMNTAISDGQTVTGTVTVDVTDGEAVIELLAGGLSEGMHMAHLHGFATEDPDEATCAGVEADANADGVVDLIETEKAAGVTLVPLTDDPAGLVIASDSYPTAGEDGQFAYTGSVDMAALGEAMREKYDTPPALASRVVFIHGVPEGIALPDSVRSLEGVPARATLPIACAELNPAL